MMFFHFLTSHSLSHILLSAQCYDDVAGFEDVDEVPHEVFCYNTISYRDDSYRHYNCLQKKMKREVTRQLKPITTIQNPTIPRVIFCFFNCPARVGLTTIITWNSDKIPARENHNQTKLPSFGNQDSQP